MLGNYKLANVSGKLQSLCVPVRLLIWIFTQTGNLKLIFTQGISAHLPLSLLSVFPLHIHLFCQSPSVFPAPLSLSSAVECASQQYLMKVWLTGRCWMRPSVFSCVMCVHVASQTRWEARNVSRKRVRIGYFHWESTTNIPGRSFPVEVSLCLCPWERLQYRLFQAWTMAEWTLTNQIHTPGSVNSTTPGCGPRESPVETKLLR